MGRGVGSVFLRLGAAAAALPLVWVLAACGAGGLPARPASGGAAPPTVLTAPRTVVAADAGDTVVLAVGDRFTLELGDAAWTVTVADTSIVRRLPNFMMIRGAQGIYQAYADGRTSLDASAPGGPCTSAQMPCAPKAQSFHVELVVSG
jgi:hypothetical protein